MKYACGTARRRRTEAGANVDRGTEGAPGSYNNFWLDRGTQAVGTRRSSLIVDPPNGRYPPMTPEGQRRAEARAAHRSAQPADSWLDFSTYDRCLLGFNAGPPMNPERVQQQHAVVPDAGPRRDRDRDGEHRAHRPARRASRAPGRHAPVVGRVARALGGRHARHRDGELRRPAAVALHDRGHAPGRAADARSMRRRCATRPP